MLSKKSLPIFILFVFLIIFTRFWNLTWSGNFGFHPDENNMVSAVLRFTANNFNPDFFAYGQFPLYLTYFTALKHNSLNIAFTLRFWSAVFSSFSILFFYLIVKKIFKSNKIAAIFSLLIIFTPGLIQLAHFGTTESILIFVFTVNIYLSFLFFDFPGKYGYLFFLGLVSGIGIATKLSAVFFLAPVCFSFLFLFLKKPQKFFSLFLKFIFFISVTAFFSILLSPYSLINLSDFLSSMKYEIGVANGSIPVFYTRQFIHTIPYVFQFQKIFPYVNGITIFIFSLIGLYFFAKNFFQKINSYLLITLFSSLIYFLYQGQLFAKWTRFMSPVFFCGPLLSLFFFKQLKSKIWQISFVILSILPGIYFFIITYFLPDTRIQATYWINQNISDQTQVLSEGGNVVDIPLFDSKINVNNFDFYELDTNQTDDKLDNLINQSNYIFVPSRRVFKNQDNSSFPISQKYYQSLFSGSLGFSQIKIFSKSNSLLLNSENAEETFSVFDNPTIRIFKKNES